MINRLPRNPSAVHADVEAICRAIYFENIGLKLIEKDAEGAALWLK